MNSHEWALIDLAGVFSDNNIFYMIIGEKMDDLRPFDAKELVEAIFA